jgi:hypothetical protein
MRKLGLCTIYFIVRGASNNYNDDDNRSNDNNNNNNESEILPLINFTPNIILTKIQNRNHMARAKCNTAIYFFNEAHSLLLSDVLFPLISNPLFSQVYCHRVNTHLQ